MVPNPERGDERPAEMAEPPLEDWRIDWNNLDERRRERHRRDAAGASRDIGASLLAGGL